jgi:hypothetical protein
MAAHFPSVKGERQGLTGTSGCVTIVVHRQNSGVWVEKRKGVMSNEQATWTQLYTVKK